jgi:FemAB-related protein (PEP-CTERM system-associated)
MGGEEFLKGFYQIYAHSVRNLGTPVLPMRFMVNLLREFGPACRILAIFHEEHMVAGVMTFFFRDQVMPYYGGALRHAFRYAVNDFMYWHLLCYGAELGYRIFDFGRSKKGTGSYDFKRHWGFEPTPLAYQYHLVRQKTIPDQNPLNPRFALAIQTWKRMPLWLSRWLGPRVVRFFP